MKDWCGAGAARSKGRCRANVGLMQGGLGLVKSWCKPNVGLMQGWCRADVGRGLRLPHCCVCSAHLGHG